MKHKRTPVIATLFLAIVGSVIVGSMAYLAAEMSTTEIPNTILTPEVIKRVKEFHGHSCSGSYIGLRAAEWAVREFKTDERERIIVVVETSFCGVDSLQVILGTTTGLGNLIVRDYGKLAINFYRPRDGKSARLLWNLRETPELQKKLEAIDPQDRETRNQLMQDYILSAPFEYLFVVMETREPMPDTTRARQNVPCSVCNEDVDLARIEEKDGQNICRACLKEK